METLESLQAGLLTPGTTGDLQHSYGPAAQSKHRKESQKLGALQINFILKHSWKTNAAVCLQLQLVTFLPDLVKVCYSSTEN